MLKVLCFGNPNFKKDSLAIGVGRKLKNKIKDVEFVECGIDDDFIFESGRDSVIVLDVVEGLKRVRFVDVDELKTSRTITAHDLDVAFYLKLLAKEGKRIRVIGIPNGMEVKKAAKEVEALLTIS